MLFSMGKDKDLQASVSGSFLKYKPEIDLAIEELTDFGITVLAPEKGWLYIPPQRIYSKIDYQFRPLPSERNMSIKQIEDEFLSSVKKSDFLYVVNPDGYIGNSVAMEIGFAVAKGKPVFLQKEISELIMPGDEPAWQEIKPKLRVATIQEAVAQIRKDRDISEISPDDPKHPCFSCGNKQQDTKAVMNNDTICMDGYRPSFDCRYLFPNTVTPEALKDIK